MGPVKSTNKKGQQKYFAYRTQKRELYCIWKSLKVLMETTKTIADKRSARRRAVTAERHLIPLFFILLENLLSRSWWGYRTNFACKPITIQERIFAAAATTDSVKLSVRPHTLPELFIIKSK